MPEVRFEKQDVFSWATVAQADAVFLQRPHTKEEMGAVRCIAETGVPLWVDYDDSYFDIDRSNPAFLQVTDDIKQNVLDILSIAQVVTVSTQALATRLDSYRPYGTERCLVVPNAFPDNFVRGAWPIPQFNETVTWRGGSSHLADLRFAHKAFRMLRESFPDYDPVFFGDADWATQEVFDFKCDVRQWGTPLGFLEKLKREGAAVHIVPLCDTEFNRQKSNCAWLEASYAGSVVLAPDWPEWQHPGIIHYDSAYAFETRLMELLSGYESLRPLVQASREYIHDNLMLSTVNVLRQDILEGMLK
jgi:hypothetical protein